MLSAEDSGRVAVPPKDLRGKPQSTSVTGDALHLADGSANGARPDKTKSAGALGFSTHERLTVHTSGKH